MATASAIDPKCPNVFRGGSDPLHSTGVLVGRSAERGREPQQRQHVGALLVRTYLYENA
jgi:hypothetical protein